MNKLHFVELPVAAPNPRGVVGAWQVDGTIFVNPEHVTAIRPVWDADSDDWIYCTVALSNGGVVKIAWAAETIAARLEGEEN